MIRFSNICKAAVKKMEEKGSSSSQSAEEAVGLISSQADLDQTSRKSSPRQDHEGCGTRAANCVKSPSLQVFQEVSSRTSNRDGLRTADAGGYKV